MKTRITVFAAMLLLPCAQAVMADEGENVRPTVEKNFTASGKGVPAQVISSFDPTEPSSVATTRRAITHSRAHGSLSGKHCHRLS